MSGIDEDEYMFQIGSELDEGMEWTQELLDSSGMTNRTSPIAPGTPHPNGVVQRRPWPVGQFKTRVVKSILPFLTTLYLRAQLIHQLARNVYVFHMQSIYIARQALHLVILLNDVVDASKGPSDEQDDERNDLEDDLIELSEAMTEWGSDKGDDFEYERQATEIEHQYAQLFKERFYFHDARDCSTDPVYQRFVAYDAKTIRYRQGRETHITSPTTIEIKYWTETVEDESGSEDDTEPRFDSNIDSQLSELGQHAVEGPSVSELHTTMPASRPDGDDQSARSEGSEGLAPKPLRLAPKSRGMIRKDHLRKKNRVVTAFRIHLAITQLHVVPIRPRKLVRRGGRRWRVLSLPSRSMSLNPPAASVSRLLTSPATSPKIPMISPSFPPIRGTLPASSHLMSGHPPASSLPSASEKSTESAGSQVLLLPTLKDLTEEGKAGDFTRKTGIRGEPETIATHTTDLGDLEMSSPGSMAVVQAARGHLSILSPDAGELPKRIFLRRPCEVFQAIGGVGPGGLIALFLGVFKMTATEALGEFKGYNSDIRSTAASPLVKQAEHVEFRNTIHAAITLFAHLLLTGRYSEFRFTVASALAKLAEHTEPRNAIHAAIPSLVELVKNSDSDVPSAAASALAKLVEHVEFRNTIQAAIPLLVKLLQDKDLYVRSITVYAFAKLAERVEFRHALHATIPAFVELPGYSNARSTATSPLVKQAEHAELSSVVHTDITRSVELPRDHNSDVKSTAANASLPPYLTTSLSSQRWLTRTPSTYSVYPASAQKYSIFDHYPRRQSQVASHPLFTALFIPGQALTRDQMQYAKSYNRAIAIYNASPRKNLLACSQNGCTNVLNTFSNLVIELHWHKIASNGTCCPVCTNWFESWSAKDRHMCPGPGGHCLEEDPDADPVAPPIALLSAADPYFFHHSMHRQQYVLVAARRAIKTRRSVGPGSQLSCDFHGCAAHLPTETALMEHMFGHFRRACGGLCASCKTWIPDSKSREAHKCSHSHCQYSLIFHFFEFVLSAFR